MKEGNDADSYLSEEEVKNIEQVTVRAPDEDLTFAKVFAIKQLKNPYAEEGSYYLANDDEGVAQFLQSLKQAEKIRVDGDKVTYPVYKDAIGWELEMDDIENAKTWGRKFDVESVERAKRKVEEHMNQVAYVGDTKYGTTGIYEASGVTAISGTDIDNSSDPASDFIGYFYSLPKKFRDKYKYNIVMADSDYIKLMKRGNTYNDKSTKQIIMEALSGKLLDIMSDSDMASGTATGGGSTVSAGVAMLIPNSKDAVNIPLGMSPRTTRGIDEENRIVAGKVYARYGPPELVFPTAVGKITSLSS